MFGDIGIGILLSLVVGQAFNVPVTTAMVFAGIVFALLPDIDMLGYVFRPLKKIFGEHRGIMHYPLIHVGVAFIALILVGPMWAVFYFSGVMLHILHDTLWIGRGIPLLWPFSQKKYKSFPEKNGMISSVPWIAWNTLEEEQVWRSGGTGEHWIRVYYLRPTIVSIVEYGILAVALIALFVMTR